MLKLNKIRKAVFPVAGLGTRFLPATKASAKEMMPVVDKPLIQYAVEEAVAAGITDMIFITGRGKRAIEDHFDKAYELESELAARKRVDLLELVQNIVPQRVNCVFIRQNEALGLGHAVLCASHVVGDEPFAVLLADDLMDTGAGPSTVMTQMVALFAQQHSSILAVQNVARAETKSYGIVSTVGTAERATGSSEKILGIVEKPDPEEAPSTLAVVGRYILTPGIFEQLERVTPGRGGEIQLTDGIQLLLAQEPVLAYRYEGTRYDCGSKLGYLKATVDLGLRHPETAAAFRQHLLQHPLHT